MKFEILENDVDNSISDYQTAITFAGTQLLEKGYITAEYIDACLEREKSYPTGLMMQTVRVSPFPMPITRW